MPSTTVPATTTTTTTGGLNHLHSSSLHQVGLPSATVVVMGVGMKSSQSSLTSSGTLSHQAQHQSSYHHSPSPQSPTMLHRSSSPSSSSPQNYHHHYQQQQQQQQQDNNNYPSHHFQTPPAPLTPLMDQHLRNIDRSIRNLPYAATATGLDQADGIPPPSTRIPSLRRTRRPSGGANNNATGGIGVPGSPRVQRSPMPVRAAVVIKSRNRLGNHTDNISSGSLNSIEV